MAKETMEDLLIKQVENGIRAIKLGTKTPAEAGVGKPLNRLKEINPGLHSDLLALYKITIEKHGKIK